MDTVHVTRANEGDHWLVVTDVTTIKASGEDTSGKLLVLEVTVPPGGGPPVLHRHEYSEVFLFQEGEFEVSTVDENYAQSTIRVGAGDTVSVPSMVWHNFKNIGETPGRFTAVHSPAVMEDFMREIGHRIDDPDESTRAGWSAFRARGAEDDGDHRPLHGDAASGKDRKVNVMDRDTTVTTPAKGPQPTGDTVTDPGFHPEVSIGHVHLRVADLARATAFYRDILGFD